MQKIRAVVSAIFAAVQSLLRYPISLILAAVVGAVGGIIGFEIFQRAARREDNALVRFPSDLSTIEQWTAFLDEHRENPNALQNENGTTLALFVAKVVRTPGVMRLLVERGVDFTGLDEFYGNTPLMWAIANAHNGAAKELVESMIDGQALKINQQCVPRQNTALHLAVSKGYIDIDSQNHEVGCANTVLVDTLLQRGADPNLANKEGNTPLHLTYLSHDTDMIRMLKAYGADATAPNGDDLLPADLWNAGYEQARLILDKTVGRGLFRLDQEEYHRALPPS